MDFDERTQWAEALLACSAVRERKSRDVIVGDLPEDIRSRISRADSDQVDVMNVLKCVLEFEDGMTQFIKIVRFYERSTRPMQVVEQLYEQTYPTLLPIGNIEQAPYNPPQLSLPPILDRTQPVGIFEQLLDRDHPCRFMRLSGAAKMGKSHLLTKVFPALAQQQGARCVIMDMRGSQTVIDWLYHICMQLGIVHFPTFDKAYQDRLYRPLRPEQDIQAISSAINAQGHQRDDTPQMIPHFTRLFVDDLRQLHDRPIVLLCDAVDDSPDEIQEWLIDSLLVQLQPLPHLHIVVGGRTLPTASGSYAMICQSYELGSVEDHNAYIEYCQALEIELEDNVICEFAKIFGYAPGRFVETVHTHYLPEDHQYA